MNKVHSIRTHASRHFFMVALVGFALMTVCSTVGSAQSSVAAAPDAISTVDLVDNNWKLPAEYAAILAAERVIAAQKIAAPNVKAEELALYTGYDRMLDYMQVDLAANVAIGGIAESNFKRVVAETPADAILQNMEAAEFQTLQAALVAMLVSQ